MAEQNENIKEIVGILTKEFNKQKQGGKINPHLHNYWTKVKTVLNPDVVAALESDPESEATQEAIYNEYLEQFKSQRFIAHTAMFVNQYERS